MMDCRRFILLAVFTLISVSTFASEESFWETMAKFEEQWLKSENDAKQLLNLAEEHYSNSEKSHLMLSALAIKKFEFLKYYSSPNETIAHLEAHIDNVLVSHNFHNEYLSELALLYFQVGQLNAYEKTLEKLSKSDANIFLATIKLTTHTSIKNYQLLYSLCEQWCSFLLYHLAKAKYYAESGQYSLLNTYTEKIINEYYNLKDIRSKLFLAYFFIAMKCQNRNDERLDDMSEAIVGDVRHLKGFHNRLVSIMDTQCK